MVDLVVQVFSMPSGSSANVWRRAGAATALCALLLMALIAGHDGRRVAQIVVLVLPALLWLRMPLAEGRWRTVRLVTVTALVVLFLVDAAVRTFLQASYGALPDSSLVLASVANTTPREAAEYARSQATTIAALAAALIAAVGVAALLVRACNRHHAPLRRAERWLMPLLVLLCVAALASKPWRRHHPLLYWPAWAQSVSALQLAWSDQQRQRDALLANARGANPLITLSGPSTVVLILTDSVNRDNMSLYGYPRDTTPQLSALHADEGGRLVALRHAWSVEPGTVASLSGIFSFGARDEDDPVNNTHHVLALARAAGYRIWWMSNHDDVAIEQQHALLADEVEMINREPGRSTSNLDGELLDCVEEALADPTPRKLIVVHLLGAHPHYRLRSPEGQDPFPDQLDAVDHEMLGEERPAWLRALRRDYDRAIRYHDAVVAQTLRLSRQYAPEGGNAAWMMLSDHGQEVGHDIMHAGHSPGTAAGYRIPALVWRSGTPVSPDVARRPFRADWTGWTLADLMGLSWDAMATDRNVLAPGYMWAAPTLGVHVARFDQ